MPRQDNSVDCGVFVCLYANYASLKKVINFKQSDIPHARKRIAFEISNTLLLPNP